MLKIVLAALLVTICALIGFAVEKVYKTRLKILEEYAEFVRYAERETEFMKTDLSDLLIGYECCTELKKIFTEIADCLENCRTIECCDKHLKESALKEIISFVNNLANADYSGKNSVIKHALSVADELAEKARKEKNQKGELIRKLMILLGVGLVVITI